MHPMINVTILTLTAAACGYLSGVGELDAFLSMAAGLTVTGCIAVLLPWRA